MKPLDSGIESRGLLSGRRSPWPDVFAQTRARRLRRSCAQPAADEQRLVIWDGAEFALAMSYGRMAA